jgi:hypothetical protein
MGLRIGIIGWYGHSNAGDDRILRCLEQLLSPHEVVWTGGLCPWTVGGQDLNACDYVLLGGGGLVLRGIGRLAEMVRGLRPAMGCVGLGVESVHRDNRAFVEALLEKSQFIYVRDRASRARLGNHPKVIVGPDLTFYEPFDVVRSLDREVCGLSLRPWRFWRGEHGALYDRLMRRIHKRYPSAERLYPAAKWDPRPVVELLEKRFRRVSGIPLYTSEPGPNDKSELGKYIARVSDTFDPVEMGKCGVIVGMRFHAIVFACQMGIPFVSLSYQPKNVAFCRERGLRELSVDLWSQGHLARAMDFCVDHSDGIRQRLLRYREWAQAEVKAIMESIVRVIERYA